MSYSLKICRRSPAGSEPEVVELSGGHTLFGPNVKLGSPETRAQLSVTSNYAEIYNKLNAFSAGGRPLGLKLIADQPLVIAMEIIADAICEIHCRWKMAWYDENENYWTASPANARKALEDFLEICHMACALAPLEWDKRDGVYYAGFVVKVEC